MDSMILIPGVFLALIVLLLIWAIIFMKSYKKDKQRLSTIFPEDKNPIHQESLYLEMAESYLNKGDKEKALEYYYLYLRKVPNNGKVYYIVGDLLSEDNPAEAIEYLSKALAFGYEPAKEKLKIINETKPEDTVNKNDETEDEE